jgi:hypothetical protein
MSNLSLVDLLLEASLANSLFSVPEPPFPPVRDMARERQAQSDLSVDEMPYDSWLIILTCVVLIIVLVLFRWHCTTDKPPKW